MIASLHRTGITLLVLLALLLSATFTSCESTTETPTDNTVRIGALIALSGSGTARGQTTKAAIDVSVADFNQFLAESGSSLVIEIDSADTESNPTKALQLMEEMVDRGIKIIIGPQTSSESMAVLQRANELGVILLSPTAVANSLSIPNDNFFRMITDVTVQGQANAAYLKSEGITHLIVARIGDVWGQDLLTATRTKYEAEGGTIIQDITYAPGSVDTEALHEQLTQAVNAAIATHGAANVGVALFALGEGVQILKEVSKDDSLHRVKWLGNSALANDPRLSEDKDVVSFLQKVGFPCAVFGMDMKAQPLWKPIMEKVNAKMGRDADSYSLAAYDAVWLAAYTVMDAGSEDVETLRKVLYQNSIVYYGASGWPAMNENGDRRESNFDFWSVRAGMQGTGMWYRSASYEKSSSGAYELRKY